jgi:hypothetical protein
MSILLVPATLPYPPGITGDPYTPDDISKFYDLNWPPMYTGVKSTGFVSPGLLGLGQTDTCTTDANGDEYCTSTSSDPVITTDTPALPLTTPNVSCDSVSPSSMTAAQLLNCGYQLPTGSSSLNTPLTPAQAGLTPAQQAALIAATGNSAVSLIRTAAGGPYTVAGTNLVYNPATGQLTTPAAVNALAGVNLSSISAYIPYIALAIGAIVLLPMLTGKK